MVFFFNGLVIFMFVCFFFFFKQKTAYELRISDWSSDVCSSDLICVARTRLLVHASIAEAVLDRVRQATAEAFTIGDPLDMAVRSEEHTSELQSLMRISYAVFCLKKKKKNNKRTS